MASTISYAIPVVALRKAFTRCASSAAILRHYGFTSRSQRRIRKSPRGGEQSQNLTTKAPRHSESATTRPDLLLDLGIPNRSRILACAIRNFDSIVFAQSLPLPSIGTNLDCTAVIEHPNFYNPLFVIGRLLVFDLLALFRRRDIVPDYDCFAGFLFATAKASDQ